MSAIVRRTAQLSLGVQVIAALAQIAAYFVPVDTDEYSDVLVILSIEAASQLVELLWYLWAVLRNREITTWTRYVDWFLSTPVMLVSTAMFFAHRAQTPILDVFEDYTLYAALGLNALMLLFGLLVELQRLPRSVGVFFGSVSFVGSFTFLAVPIDDDDLLSTSLFYAVYGVWFLYGGAALLPYEPRNVSYNLLDLVSKNFYGGMLFVYLLTRP